jgi:glycosyltransferase involved in cell wall biosynthesis
VPAVAFDVGGVREWLQDDVGGRLVGELGSASAFGRTIAAICTTPGDLTRLGDGARQRARAITIDAHLDILERVFSRAIAQRAAMSCTS